MKGLLLTVTTLALVTFWPGRLEAANLNITFGTDSLRACANEPFSLSPQVSGGSGTLSFLWNTGDSTPILWTVPDTGATLFVVSVQDQAGQQATDSVWVIGYPECVWPGDADGSGAANNADVLMLGVAYGVSGALRPDAHLQWIGQPAPAWSHTFAAGVNYVHADGDGDGLVNDLDLEAIRHNYLAPQNQPGLSPVSAQGIPLYIDFPTGNHQPGDTVIATIMLGTAAQPADSVYGLAFSIPYAAYGIDPQSVIVRYDSSWLGQLGQDLTALDQNFPMHGQLDVGMSRINQIVRSGFGRVGDITVVIDDIAGKRSGIEMIDIMMDQVTLVGKHGNPLPVNPYPTQLAILLSQNDPAMLDALDLYTDQEHLYLQDKNAGRYGPRTLEIRDLHGRQIRTLILPAREQVQWPIPPLSPGVYVIRINDDRRYINQKVFLR